MTSVKNDIMAPEECAIMHQQVFRTVFNFLKYHWPPGTDPDWWLKVAKDVGETEIPAGGEFLMSELMTSVLNYIQHEYKERGGT